MKLKHLAVQVEPEMLFKFKAVCKYYGRSANGQVVQYIRHMVWIFEQEHEAIDVSALAESKEEGRT